MFNNSIKLSENQNILNVLETLSLSEQSEQLNYEKVSSQILNNQIPFCVLNNIVYGEPFLFRFIHNDQIFYNLINKLIKNNENINKFVNIAEQNLLFKSLNYVDGVVSEQIFDFLIELTKLNYLNISQQDNVNGYQAHHYCLTTKDRNNNYNFNQDYSRFIKLINHGLDITTPTKNSTNTRCVHLATTYGIDQESIHFIDLILKNNYSEIYAVDNNGNNCLHYAAFELNYKIFYYLCNRMNNKLFLFKRNYEGLNAFDIVEKMLKFYEFDANNLSIWNELYNKYQCYSDNYTAKISNIKLPNYQNRNKLLEMEQVSPCSSVSAKNIKKYNDEYKTTSDYNTPNKFTSQNLNKEKRTCRLSNLSNAEKYQGKKSNTYKYSIEKNYLDDKDQLELITSPILFNINK